MDDQRLKEMLSAWFDSELSPEERAQVEAYLERSAEAREIVARFKALKQLTDNSALNPQSDYWERSASKVEAVLGEQTITKVTPAKKSGWSNWGVKAVSIAASVALLVYVGFHSDEILHQVHEEDKVQQQQTPPSPSIDSSQDQESIIQKKAAEDKTIQRFAPGGNGQKPDVDEHINLPPKTKPVEQIESEPTYEDQRA